MLNQNGHEALHRTQNGPMDDHRSTEAGLKSLLMPRVLLLIVLIGWEDLTGQLRLLNILAKLADRFLLLSGRL